MGYKILFGFGSATGLPNLTWLEQRGWFIEGPFCMKTRNHGYNKELTSLDSGKGSQETNGIHDAFLSFETPWTENPCRTGVYNKHIKEETTKAGKVVISGLLAHIELILEKVLLLLKRQRFRTTR